MFTKKINRIILTTILASILTTGCSLLGTDNAPKPSPLVNFQPQYLAQTKWNIHVGQNLETDYLKLGPTIADQTAFVSDPKGRITAINLNNGSIRWFKYLNTPTTTHPSVGAGLVVVGTADAKVIALNESTGAVVWSATVPDQVLSAPQIGQDKVIVNTVNGQVAALSLKDGQSLWVYDHTAPVVVLRGTSIPQIAGNKVIAGFADGKIAAFSLDKGTLLWEQTLAIPQGVSQLSQMVDIVANPVISGNTIFVATYNGNIAALDLQTGKILWQHPLSSYTGLVLDDKAVYITDADSNVWAFSRANGKILWHQADLLNRVITPPALSQNGIVVGDGQAYVHWLSPVDGHFIARGLVGKKQKIYAQPGVDGNNVYVLTTHGDLIALSLGK